MASLQAIGPLLTLAGTLALVACAGAGGTQQSLAACPGRGNGGGFTAQGEYELVYAVRHDSSGPHLDAAVAVHAPLSWRQRPPPDSQPRQWRPPGAPPRAINGATAGPLWIGHEGPTGMVWLDSLPVPLHDDNVLLLEVGASDEPRVVGRAHIESSLPVTAGCGRPRTQQEAEAFQQSVWTAVRRASVVRNFLDR